MRILFAPRRERVRMCVNLARRPCEYLANLCEFCGPVANTLRYPNVRYMTVTAVTTTLALGILAIRFANFVRIQRSRLEFGNPRANLCESCENTVRIWCE